MKQTDSNIADGNGSGANALSDVRPCRDAVVTYLRFGQRQEKPECRKYAKRINVRELGHVVIPPLLIAAKSRN